MLNLGFQKGSVPLVDPGEDDEPPLELVMDNVNNGSTGDDVKMRYHDLSYIGVVIMAVGGKKNYNFCITEV